MLNGRRTIRLHAPGARNVEVMSDFTEWQALGLRPVAGGWWTTTTAIRPGVYQLNVRVNGGEWDAPAGVPVTVDEFGTRVGVLILR
jgi:1,4-alpha-glucan branching enzyme